MDYQIFYGNGKVYKSGSKRKPPVRNVQVILQDDPESGPYFQSGADYYVWREDRWVGVDQFGLFDYLLDSGIYRYKDLGHQLLVAGEWLKLKDTFELYHHLMVLNPVLVIFGRTITNEEYQKIYQKAKVQKKTWRPLERKP